MISQDQVRGLEGATAYDRSGEKIGKVGGVYNDDRTDQPKWVTVHTGLFGVNETFVPVHDAQISGDRVTRQGHGEGRPPHLPGRAPVAARGGAALPQTVTEQQTVGGEVRKEQIDLDRGDTSVVDVREGDVRDAERGRY